MISDKELADVEFRLEEIMDEHGLSWVRSEVDDAGSRGVVEEIDEPDLPAPGFSRFQPDIPWVSSPKRRTGSASRIVNRPRTRRERVVALIEALRRVVVDLPNAEQSTFSLLNHEGEVVSGIADATAPRVLSLQFLPDEDDPVRRETRLDVRDRRFDVARHDLEQLLNALSEEVRDR